MSELRSKVVDEARKAGICTQCINRRATKDRLQCQRCIDTNNRKRAKRKHKYDEYQTRNHDRRSLNNKYRTKINEYAITVGICTTCHGRPVSGDLRQCDTCLERKRRWKITKAGIERPVGRPVGVHTKWKKEKKPKNKKQLRAYAREYKKKALYNKVRKLDQISYAVEKGRVL